MTTLQIQTKRARLWRLAATLVLLGAAAWLLAAHWPVLHRGLQTARSASWGWLGGGLVLTAVTFCIAAGIYRLLALKNVRYRQLLLVELAAAFANRLLPAGLGGLSLHGLYLYRRHHTPAQATAVVSVNNLLGITTHLALLTGVICFQPALLKQFAGHFNGVHWWYVGLLLALAGAACLFQTVRREVGRFGSNLLKSFRSLRPPRLAAACLLALCLTTTYTLVLYSAEHAVGGRLDLLQVFVVFSLGMLVGTATPTPGGLVGVEAGLYAGFVGYGLAAPIAAAAVIIFRLLTYWLPLVPGCLALLVARHRHLV